jgi:hypothetical protein
MMAETQRVSSPPTSRTAYAGPRRLPADAPQSPPDPPAPPSLTKTEKRLGGVLLLGMASTAAVLLLKGPALPRADVLLGSTILFAGLSLLVAIGLCRR